MATVSFKRGTTTQMNNTPVTDGMLFYNTENHKIFMDNGSERLQYGGDTDLISDPSEATVTNVFSATSSVDLFPLKTTVLDSKTNALAVTQEHIPLGCLAFKSAVGTTDISTIGDGTISGAVLSAYNNGTTALNYLNNTGIPALARHDNQLTAPTGAQMYMDYQGGKYGVNTSAARGADTFIPFNDTTPIYNALVAKGVYPSANTTEAIVSAINTMQLDVQHTVNCSWEYRGDEGGGTRYHIVGRVDGSVVYDEDWVVRNSWGTTV